MYSLKKRPFSVNNLSDIDVVKSSFPEVYQTTTDLNNFSKKEIDNPFKPGSKITIDKLVRKIQVDGFKNPIHLIKNNQNAINNNQGANPSSQLVQSIFSPSKLVDFKGEF